MPPVGEPEGSKINASAPHFLADPASVIRLGLSTLQERPTQLAELAVRWALGQSFGGVVFGNHKDWVPGLALSRAGDTLLTASVDGTLMLWNPDTGELKGTLTLNSPARFFSGQPQFSSDGSLLLVTTVAGRVHLGRWEGQTSLPILPAGENPPPATRAVLDASARLVAIGYVNGIVRVLRWPAAGDEPLVLGAPAEDQITALAFSPQGLLVTGSELGKVRLWDLDHPLEPVVLEGHNGMVRTVDVSGDGRFLVTAGNDRTARLFKLDSTDPDVVVLTGNRDEVLVARFSPDRRRVITGGGDTTVRAYEVPGGEQVSVLERHTGEVLDIHVSKDSRRVVSASEDGTAVVSDLNSGGQVAVLQSPGGMMFTARFGPGNSVFTAGADPFARRWDMGEEVVYGDHNDAVASAAFDDTGRLVVTASDDHRSHIYEAETGRRLKVLQDPDGPVRSASFSPGGNLVLTAAGKVARVWRWQEGELVRELVHRGELNTAEFNREGDKVVTTIHPLHSIHHPQQVDHGMIWNLQSNEQVPLRLPNEEAEKPFAILVDGSFNRNDTLVVTAVFNKLALLWDARTGQLVRALRGHRSFVYGSTFRPEVNEVAAAGGNGEILIWNVATGRVRFVLRSPSSQLRSAAFNDDGSRLVAGVDNGSVVVWDVSNEQVLAVERHHAHRINTACFRPGSGNQILTSSDDEMAKLYRFQSLGSLDELLQVAQQREQLSRSDPYR